MRRYSVEYVSRPHGVGMDLVIVDAPLWTRWLIALGYYVLRLTNDKCGVELVARAYRIHDRSARRFQIPATPRTAGNFRQWSRLARRR